MAHTYAVLLYHLVFSTKGRAPILDPEARRILFPYMAGIIANHGGFALTVNGVADHVHILCRLRTTPEVATVVQSIKGGSSAWFNAESGMNPIRWQEGYGAFTVSYSQKDRVHRYIENQEVHHRKKTFAEEYEQFLIANGVEFDRRFFLD
jgi:REP element-mobilizing transposase RayT